MASGETVYCNQCGRASDAAGLVSLAGISVCAACKPALLRRMQEGGVAAGKFRYMGFWIRAAAYIIDGLSLAVVFLPLLIPYFFIPLFHAVAKAAAQPPTPFQPPVVPLQLSLVLYLVEMAEIAALLAYQTFFWGRWGATLGDMAIGARVVGLDGQPISYARALGRAAMKVVSGWILCVGFLMAAFDGQKRTLHDRVAGTLVVAKPANQ